MSATVVRSRLLVQSWTDVAVVGGAGAVEGEIAPPRELADFFTTEPFEDRDLPATGRHASGPRALVAAIGRALAGTVGERVPAGGGRGIVVGTDAAALSEVIFFLDEIDSVGAALVNPGLFPFTVMNAAAGLAAIRHGCHGPNVTLNNGSASALEAIACAADLLVTGQADLVLAGGFEGLSPKANAGLRREGLPGAMSAVLALATMASATSLGLPVLARVLTFAAAGEGVGDVRAAALAAAAPWAGRLQPAQGATVTTAEDSLRSLLVPLRPASGPTLLPLTATGAGGTATLVFATGERNDEPLN